MGPLILLGGMGGQGLSSY